MTSDSFTRLSKELYMNKSISRHLAAIAAALSLAAAALPAAAVDVDLVVKVAPPAPRIEVAPAPRVGFIWAPGYWDWRGNQHVWVAGNWQRERAGYRYAAPVWVERNGEWHLTRGQWARGDRDGDGKPNVTDRDRDGDGVRNRRDNQPAVPN
jgi:WXXGXW repeat (2 copies)